MHKLNIRIKEVDGKSPHYMSGYAVKGCYSVTASQPRQCQTKLRFAGTLCCHWLWYNDEDYTIFVLFFCPDKKKASITLSALSQRRLLIFHSYWQIPLYYSPKGGSDLSENRHTSSQRLVRKISLYRTVHKHFSGGTIHVKVSKI